VNTGRIEKYFGVCRLRVGSYHTPHFGVHKPDPKPDSLIGQDCWKVTISAALFWPLFRGGRKRGLWCGGSGREEKRICLFQIFQTMVPTGENHNPPCLPHKGPNRSLASRFLATCFELCGWRTIVILPSCRSLPSRAKDKAALQAPLMTAWCN